MKAVEFPKSSKWFNTLKPIEMKNLKGHVVLLDFWTSCCINCIHVLPELKYLEQKLIDEPFIIIGVHTPKFSHEQEEETILSAVGRYEIEHPVIQDNEYYLWRQYAIHAWPGFILIGADGNVTARASGEGNRDALLKEIQKALDKGKSESILAKTKFQPEKPKIKDSLFKYPGKIAVDPQTSSLFISDSNHNRIIHTHFKSQTEVTITDIIGSGSAGLKDGGYKESTFYHPQGLTVSGDMLYVCDTENHVLREINLKEKSVNTAAGTGSKAGYSNRGGNARDVSLNSPWDCVLYNGSIFIAMAGSHEIWVYEPDKKYVGVFAGNKQEDIIDGSFLKASLAQPSGITSGKDAIYFTDSEVSAVRVLDFQKEAVLTLIGSGLFEFGFQDGTFGEAQLQHPLGLFYNNEKLYIADTFNNAVRAADLNKRELKTLIHTTDNGVCTLENKECKEIGLNEPSGVVFFNNALYVADTNNHLIRVYCLDTGELKTLEIT